MAHSNPMTRIAFRQQGLFSLPLVLPLVLPLQPLLPLPLRPLSAVLYLDPLPVVGRPPGGSPI